jgi:hypothetical protein
MVKMLPIPNGQYVLLPKFNYIVDVSINDGDDCLDTVWTVFDSVGNPIFKLDSIIPQSMIGEIAREINSGRYKGMDDESPRIHWTDAESLRDLAKEVEKERQRLAGFVSLVGLHQAQYQHRCRRLGNIRAELLELAETYES